MKKKYLLSLITLLAVAIATLIWDHINLTFDYQNQVYGEYAKQNYNPQNDTIRYIFFISIPLITFFVIYLNFYKKNLFTINQVLTAKVTHQSGLEENKLIDFFFYIIILFLIVDFIFLDYNKYIFNLDFFHEGIYLTAAKNQQLKSGFWTSSYLEYGLYGNLFPVIFWKVFNLETIGSIRFYYVFLTLLNKILIVVISREISKKINLNKIPKIYYFTFLSIFATSLVHYEYWQSNIPVRFFLVLVFLLVFFDSIKISNNFFNSNFLLGIFSSVSMFSYIDIGAYLNVFLFFLLIYLIYRKEFKNFNLILLGVIFGWVLFFVFLSNNEISVFFENTMIVFSNGDYLDGLIYPTPFISKDARSTRALLLIIITGILVIIYNFDKRIRAKTETKIFFSFLYLLNVLVFKSAMLRSDTPHIKASSGLLIFLLISIGLYFIITKLINLYENKKLSNKKFYIFKKFYLTLPLAILFFNFVLIPINSLNLKNLSLSEMKNLLIQKDEKYLSSDYVEMIDYYKKLVKKEKCIQIFTNETAIPYLLKKPTCSKFYSMWVSAPSRNQKLFIEELKLSKPKFILYGSEKDLYGDTHERLSTVLSFIDNNYSFHSKFKSWTFVKINLDY